MAVEPKVEIGDTVNLDIPYPGGTAHFKNVPVLRTGILQWYNKELGMHW